MVDPLTMCRNGLVAAALMVAASAPAAVAQAPRRGPSDEAGVTPAEIQRMFDAYALVQAQDQLQLRDDQFTQFLPRFRALQEVRRRLQGERTRLIQQLRQASADPKTDDGTLRDELRKLQDLDARSAADVGKALDAIDQVLDVRQQARFRAFEELMERRKIELVTRARQNSRPRVLPRGQ